MFLKVFVVCCITKFLFYFSDFNVSGENVMYVLIVDSSGAESFLGINVRFLWGGFAL